MHAVYDTEKAVGAVCFNRFDRRGFLEYTAIPAR